MTDAAPNTDWPTRPLGETGITVGPCAWRISALLDHADFVRGRPSLVVVHPDDDDNAVRAAAPRLAGLPVLLLLREPAFARRLPQAIADRMTLIARPRVDAVALWVDEPAELKSGGMLGHLSQLRAAGVFDHLGLAHGDVLGAEWLALHTAARLLMLPYSLADQSARHRATDAAEAEGMACISLTEPAGDEETAFALGESRRVVPVLAAPPPAAPLSADQVETRWQEFRDTHAAPPPLPRSKPPDAG